MWLEDIALHVRSLALDGVGDEVYIYDIAFENNPFVLFSPPFQGAVLDKEITGLVKTSTQMTVRGSTPGEVEALANLVWPNLQIEEAQIGGTYFKYIHPRYLPVVYPKTAGGYYEANVAFDICFIHDFG